MSLRPDADDLHVAPPLVRADDAFLAQLAAVSAASTARDRHRAERHPGMRVAFAAASVAAVVTGGTFTAGTLMDADATDRRHTPPAERPHDRASADVEEPAHAVEPTAGPQPDTGKPREQPPRAYDDGDGAADRDDDQGDARDDRGRVSDRAGSAVDHGWGTGGRHGRGRGWEHRHAPRSPRGA